MFSIRTDLAMEAHELCKKAAQEAPEIEGVSAETRTEGNVKITAVKVLNQQGAQAIGKPEGSYITIESPEIKYSTEDYEKTCQVLCQEIKKLADIKNDTVTLVVGLGNRDITPDALGTDVVSQLMVTHHVKQQMPELFGENVRSVCALAPGVLGTTGMESSEIIKGVADKLKPDLVIVVDALAAADYHRISTTFQVCDTGIQPGAGVGNNRAGINQETLGAKVLAIGVPTVVDAWSIGAEQQERQEDMDPLMVTPKDIDLVIERASKTIANGINLALHENLSLKDIEEYVG